MTGERPCPCGGSNENCARCGGLGSYTPLSAAPFVPAATMRVWTTSQQPASHPGTLDWVCPKCFAVLLCGSNDQQEALQRLALHEGSAHSAKLSINANVWTRCKLCKADLKCQNLSRHMRHVHQRTSVVSTTAAPGTRSREAGERPTRSTRTTSARVAIRPVHVRGRKDDEKGARNDYETERRLDGSRDYWGYREDNGRFESYPSFDDFGDESEP